MWAQKKTERWAWPLNPQVSLSSHSQETIGEAESEIPITVSLQP